MPVEWFGAWMGIGFCSQKMCRGQWFHQLSHLFFSINGKLCFIYFLVEPSCVEDISYHADDVCVAWHRLGSNFSWRLTWCFDLLPLFWVHNNTWNPPYLNMFWFYKCNKSSRILFFCDIQKVFDSFLFTKTHARH